MELVGVGFQGGVAAEEFSVDDLLNFTNEDVLFGVEDEEEEENSRSRERKLEGDRGLCSDSGETEAFLLGEGSMEISFPADHLADLEWLSQFVDDSFDVSEPLPVSSPAQPPGHRDDYRSEPEVHSSPAKVCFNASVPGKARSKRARTGGRVWSLCLGPFPGSPATSGSSSNLGTEPGYSFLNHQVKKYKKRKGPGREPGSAGSVQQPVRRCSHCGVQKTPQWRAGPMGTKTLCNACGVRFKSGRLFPEYRPACSPTFCSELHSNHHRKVLEMRRKKETPNHLGQANLELIPVMEKKVLASGLVILEPARFGVGEFRHAQMV